MHARYDIEIYQRLESLLGKTLPLYPTEKDEVMALMERVSEAQRLAKTVRSLAVVSAMHGFRGMCPLQEMTRSNEEPKRKKRRIM